MSEYLVIYEQAEDGDWGAYLPDLPGVIGLGGTRAEAEVRIKEALAAYAECVAEDEQQLPRPVHQAGTVTA